GNVRIMDLTLRETIVLTTMVVVIFWIGIFPRPLLHVSEPLLQKSAPTASYGHPLQPQGGGE
ncbi:MAG TPA: hypothetical protein VEJ22_05895, partial [Nitrospirota bacterium]|nr:hypothetical protein [Nitrospirota bacterium]